MKITNNANLPSPLVKAISNDGYDRGQCDFTVTELINPPRARELVRRHWHEIVEDASKMIWRLIGNIGHEILERAADPEYTEQRFYGKVAGKIVSGRADLHFDGGFYHIWDYKFTSVYALKDGIKPEWEQQVNMLRWLIASQYRRWKVDKASICAIYRDWSAPRAAREQDYPQQDVQVFEVKLWTLPQTLKFMEGRVRAHLAARKALPLCTDEERWATQEKWAVKKKGAKRAEKLCDSEKVAEMIARQWNVGSYPPMEVEHRPKEYKRCTLYCRAFPFCDQANPNLMEKPI